MGWTKTIQVSHWGPNIKNAFFICGCSPKSGPWWQRRLGTSRLTAKGTEQWGNKLQRIMFGKTCGSKTGKGCRTPCGQTPRRPCYPKLLLLNPHVNKGPRPSHLWLGPSWIPIPPFKPACKWGITSLPSVVTPLVGPDYAPQTRMWMGDYVPPTCGYTPCTSRLRPLNPHVNGGLRPSHLWLRPSYVPITPLKPACKWGITSLLALWPYTIV